MSSSRRVLRRRWLAALPLLALAGCGFELRRAADLQFQSIALAGFAPRSPLAEELRVALERTVQVKASPDQAQVILQALSEERLRRVVAFTASGQVRDIQLRLRWNHEFQENVSTVDTSFASNPGTVFTVTDEHLPRDSGVLGIGFHLYTQRAIRFRLDYDTRFSSEDQAHLITGQMEYRW